MMVPGLAASSAVYIPLPVRAAVALGPTFDDNARPESYATGGASSHSLSVGLPSPGLYYPCVAHFVPFPPTAATGGGHGSSSEESQSWPGCRACFRYFPLPLPSLAEQNSPLIGRSSAVATMMAPSGGGTDSTVMGPDRRGGDEQSVGETLPVVQIRCQQCVFGGAGRSRDAAMELPEVANGDASSEEPRAVASLCGGRIAGAEEIAWGSRGWR